MTWEPMHEREEKYGKAGVPNIYGDVYENAIKEPVTTTTEQPLGGNLPPLNLNDPANLEAFYGNFAFFDHYRKSILAQCHELLRAKYVDANEKVTETRLENEARLHPIYLDFLATHFQGRHQRERNVFESLRQGV